MISVHAAIAWASESLPSSLAQLSICLSVGAELGAATAANENPTNESAVNSFMRCPPSCALRLDSLSINRAPPAIPSPDRLCELADYAIRAANEGFANGRNGSKLAISIATKKPPVTRSLSRSARPGLIDPREGRELVEGRRARQRPFERSRA